MGGKAFHERLPDHAFPRLPPALYYELRARLLPRLQQLYEHVTVPMEAPEKADYGDLDFLVADPKLAIASPEKVQTTVNAIQEDIKQALGADSLIPFPATSHYAIPITEEWRTHASLSSSPIIEEGKIAVSCQVDVHVCADKVEWELVRFMHGYGDVGMILGLFARNVGLSLGTVGLKILMKTANPPFHLSSSVPEIANFFGLSLDAWEQGFSTERAAFKWVATSRFFSVQRMREAHSKKRRTETRGMYSRFVDWAQEQPLPQTPVPPAEAIVAEALAYFGKKAEYDGLIEEYALMAAKIEARKALKLMFNGTVVGEWTGLDNRRVKIVMDKIRQEQGGELGLLGLEQSRIRQLVESAVAQLGFVEHPTEDSENVSE